jgi:platelet-activating factor acetylhydrolase
MDIEVPAETPRTISNITRDGTHVLRLETVLFTLYYPAALGTGRGKDPAGYRKWSRGTWLSRPRAETARGYAKLVTPCTKCTRDITDFVPPRLGSPAYRTGS